jgi:threonine/homoserine efflux transporter RhtA
MEAMLSGAIAMGSAVIGLFFFRYWRRTRDGFFLLFAASFWIEAGNRVALVTFPHASEDEPVFYMVRLLAYALILLAIWRKNRAPR